MHRLLTDLAVTVAAMVLLIFVRDEAATGLLVGVLATTALSLAHAAVEERSRLKYLWLSVRYWNTSIRISASYLFRIKVDDEYMLIRGERFPDQYQPVGGVYKMLAAGRSFLKHLDVLDDDLLPVDDTSRDDLRIRVTGRHLWSFIRWYDGEDGREADQWREFSEELVVPGILSFQDFPHITVDRIRRHEEFRFSEYAQSQELLLADVCEPVLTTTQTAALRVLKSEEGTDTIRFVSEDAIRRLGFPRSSNRSSKFRLQQRGRSSTLESVRGRRYRKQAAEAGAGAGPATRPTARSPRDVVGAAERSTGLRTLSVEHRSVSTAGWNSSHTTNSGGDECLAVLGEEANLPGDGPDRPVMEAFEAVDAHSHLALLLWRREWDFQLEDL